MAAAQVSDTLLRLELIAVALKDAQTHVRDLEHQRRLLIDHALAEGVRQADIMRVIGVSRARVHQLAGRTTN